jgi:hypothetical protein
MYPRESAMHSAVNPNPVAAMLASVLSSVPAAAARSFTNPVTVLASFQKY